MSEQPAPTLAALDCADGSGTYPVSGGYFHHRAGRCSNLSDLCLREFRGGLTVPLGACPVSDHVGSIFSRRSIQQVSRVDATKMPVAAQVTGLHWPHGGLSANEDECDVMGEAYTPFPPDPPIAFRTSKRPELTFVCPNQDGRSQPRQRCAMLRHVGPLVQGRPGPGQLTLRPVHLILRRDGGL